MNSTIIILLFNYMIIQSRYLIINHDIIKSPLYTITTPQYIINTTDITDSTYNKDYYIYNINIDLPKKKNINIFSIDTKTNLYDDEIYNLLLDIKDSLYDSEYSEYTNSLYIQRIRKRNEKIIEQKFIY